MAELSRGLAIKTLQLQMEYVASSLEDEALDIAQDTQNAGFFLLRYRSLAVQPSIPLHHVICRSSHA